MATWQGASRLLRQHAAVLLLLAFALLHIPHFAMQISGEHRWRQCDTDSVARNFVEESFNILEPRIDVRGPTSGMAGMEFPLFSFLIAIAYLLSGTTWVGFGKLLAFVYAVGILFLIAEIIRRTRPADEASGQSLFLVSACGCLSPFFFRYSAMVLPETMALFFGLSGFVLFYRYLGALRWTTLALAAACFSLGALLRPYTLFLAMPMVSFFLFSRRLPFANRLAVLVAGVAVWVPVFYWFFVHAVQLSDSTGLWYFSIHGSYFTGRQWIGIDGGSYLESSTWLGALEILVGRYLGYGLVAIFCGGLLVTARRAKTTLVGDRSRDPALLAELPQLAFAALATMIVLPAIVGTHFLVHPYYLIAALPVLLTTSTAGLSALWSRSRLLFAGAVVAMTVYAGVDARYTYGRDGDLTLLDEMVPQILAVSAPEDLFVVDATPFYLCVIGRRGWYMDFDQHERWGRLRSDLNALTHLDGAKFALRKKTEAGEVVGFELSRLPWPVAPEGPAADEE